MTEPVSIGRCANCGWEEPGPFCPQCGQNQRDPRQSLWIWLREAVDEVFSLDGKVPKSLFLLVARPGWLTQEWIAGRRTRYVSPIRIYLISSVVFAVVAFSLGFPLPGLSAAQFAALEGTSVIESLQNSFQVAITIAVIVFVPLLTVALKLLYLRFGGYLVDYLVFALHFVSASFVLWSIVWPALFFEMFAGSVALLGGLVTLAFLFLSLRGAFGQPRSWTLVKSAVLPFLVLLPLAPFSTRIAYMLGRQWGAVTAEWDAAAGEAANRLFTDWRIAQERGDLEAATTLLPDLLELYHRADRAALSQHQLYHFAEVLLAASDLDAARATAEEILRTRPEHILALSVAARAADRQGDSAAAARFFAILVDNFDRSSALQREEYSNHGLAFDGAREAALRFMSAQPRRP